MNIQRDINNNPTDKESDDSIDIALIYHDKTFSDPAELDRILDIIDNSNNNNILFVKLRYRNTFFYKFYKSNYQLKCYISNEHTKRY